MDTQQEVRSARRRHSDELKNQVLAECAQPGAWLAPMALAQALAAAPLSAPWLREVLR